MVASLVVKRLSTGSRCYGLAITIVGAGLKPAFWHRIPSPSTGEAEGYGLAITIVGAGLKPAFWHIPSPSTGEG